MKWVTDHNLLLFTSYQYLANSWLLLRYLEFGWANVKRVTRCSFQFLQIGTTIQVSPRQVLTNSAVRTSKARGAFASEPVHSIHTDPSVVTVNEKCSSQPSTLFHWPITAWLIKASTALWGDFILLFISLKRKSIMLDKQYCLAGQQWNNNILQMRGEAHPQNSRRWNRLSSEYKECPTFSKYIVLIHEAQNMASEWTTEKDKVDCFTHTSVFSPVNHKHQPLYLKYSHFSSQKFSFVFKHVIHSNRSHRTF